MKNEARKRKPVEQLASFDRRGRFIAVSIRRDVLAMLDKEIARMERILRVELSRSDGLRLVIEEWKRGEHQVTPTDPTFLGLSRE